MFKHMDELGRKRIPFFFAINFLKTEVIVVPLSDCPKDIRFKCDEYSVNTIIPKNVEIPNKTIKSMNPISLKDYKKAFNCVHEEMRAGNTYLLNLTFPTKIVINESFDQLYDGSNAKFKCVIRDRFLSFSPERFIKMEGDKIYTYPMKGTSQVQDDPSGDLLIKSKKESTEHLMIVDLLRNDLNQVASNITVQNFRFKEKIYTGTDWIWQTSSEIEGTLHNWQDQIGTILDKLLPAGSISGSPKSRTVDIIKNIESDDRGFYTGVFGYYDGEKLDSGVLIRFIEKTKNGQYIYRSGGGITIQSDVNQEYQELLDKIYIPTVKKYPLLQEG
ncbi:MAG: aminodeoxychorismate synthase component I [Candidatus Margulisbacteria bacterium GWF2_35_9]|nr:MAG: aminodeoxychorismate synthase component I [Candidatus Margulisbacteria bacterium GWF2_35_9]